MDSIGMLDLERRLSGDLTSLDDFARELSRLDSGRPSASPVSVGHGDAAPFDPQGADFGGRLNADPATVEQGLAKLVLSLIELLRRLLEKQALRRIEAGSLSEVEIERMGETFLRLERKMNELKATFSLTDGDLNLNLGPIADLIQDA
ncbi:MAG: gas vesicle protein K [Chloroflexota bacterium]